MPPTIKEHDLHVWLNLPYPFWAWMWCTLPLRWELFGIWVIPVIIFERKSGSFSSPNYVLMSLLLLTREAVQKLGRNLTHEQIVLYNALTKSKWNFQHVSIFMDTDSPVFEDKLLHRIHILVRFARQAMGIPIVHLQQRLCCFWTWRTIQKLYPSHCLLSESYFQHSKSSCSIFLQFNVKFDTLLYQVPIS
jgi:hypothetical protein